MGNDLVERRIASHLKQAEAEASVLTMWNGKEYPNSPQKPITIGQTKAYATAEMLKELATRIATLTRERDEAKEAALEEAAALLDGGGKWNCLPSSYIDDQMCRMASAIRALKTPKPRI